MNTIQFDIGKNTFFSSQYPKNDFSCLSLNIDDCICQNNTNTNEYFSLSSFLIFLSILQFGVLFSSTIVALFVYKPMKENKRLTCIPEPDLEIYFRPKEVIYEEKYNLKKALKSTDRKNNDTTTFEVPKNSYVMESTPNGNILMKYDMDEEGFVYWSDTNSIPYKYLEVVARKYVSQFCCKELYIGHEVYDIDSSSDDDFTDTDAELVSDNESDSVVSLVNDDESDNEQEKQKEESVFATFKKSNNTNNKGETQKREVICKNKYIHRGKIKDFSFFVKPNRGDENEDEAITFSYFKQFMNNMK
jgi:hypothetical protein